MRINKLQYLTLMIILILSTFIYCSKIDNNHPLHNIWYFESFEYTVQGVIEFQPDSILNPMRIDLMDRKNFYGYAVNKFWGKYKATKNMSIEISIEGITEMYGGELSQTWEKRFVESLKKTNSYKVENKTLKLFLNDNSHIMNFYTN